MPRYISNIFHVSITVNYESNRSGFKTSTLCPRVVPNQKEKFESDDLMKKHTREGEVSLRDNLPLHLVKLCVCVIDSFIRLFSSISHSIVPLLWQ